MPTIKEELEQIRLEREKLQLELERAQVAQLKADREKKQRTLEQNEADLAQAKRNQDTAQRICTHRKGGTDLAALSSNQGTDGRDYAVIKHQLPTGDTMVMCLRCQKIWKPGDPDYQEALGFPTMNGYSRSNQFRVTRVA